MQTFYMPQNIVLADKREIVLNHNDKNDIFLSIIDNGQVTYTFPISSQLSGYGGGLYLSSSEQYLLFSYYSGQSSETFMLFKIDALLELLFDSGDMYGEDGDFYFSDDETFLMQTLRTGWWYAGEEDINKNGDKFYEFGVINILKIKDKTLDKHIVYVYISDDWKEEITDIGPFEISEITDSFVKLAMPWGNEALLLPLNRDVIIRR